MNSSESTARDWALAVERDRTGQRFEEIARAVDAHLLRGMHAYACRRVGAADAEEAVDRAWEKVLNSFDPARGSFKSFFFKVLHRVCIDMLRARKREPLPASETSRADRTPGAAVPEFTDGVGAEDEFFRRFDDVEDLILAAIDMLGLSAKDRAVLSLLVDGGSAVPAADSRAGDSRAADSRAGAAQRQRRKRALDRLFTLAGLTAEERCAVALIREHRTVTAAVAAAPGIDVRRLYDSAKRKVLPLMGIETEEDSA